MSLRAYGWLPPETFGRSALKGVRTASPSCQTPDNVDLTPTMPPMYDQGTEGSCVAQALAAGVEDLCALQAVRHERPSRKALYWLARQRIGTVMQDSGCLLMDAASVLGELGWSPEELWSPDRELTERPGPAVFEAMEHRRLVNWEPLDHDAETLRWELSLGHPVAVGLRVYRGLDFPGPNGRIPPPEGKSVGGHAMLLVGYSKSERIFRIRNSWGPSWGENGYGEIEESYVTDPFQCGEILALRAVRYVDAQPPRPL